MDRIRKFLTATPFLKYLAVAAFAALVLFKAGVWAKHRVESYVYETVLPRVLNQAKAAATDAIRQGANGALSDATGGLFGSRPPGVSQTDRLTHGGAPGEARQDPCRAPTVPTFGLPGLPRLP